MHSSIPHNPVVLCIGHIQLVSFSFSGLNVDNDCILEMACVVTDDELNTVAEVSVVTYTVTVLKLSHTL